MGIVKSILNYLIIFGIPVLVIMSLMSFLDIHLGYILVPFVAISSILLFIYYPYIGFGLLILGLIIMLYLKNRIKTTINDPIKEKAYKELFDELKKRKKEDKK